MNTFRTLTALVLVSALLSGCGARQEGTGADTDPASPAVEAPAREASPAETETMPSDEADPAMSDTLPTTDNPPPPPPG